MWEQAEKRSFTQSLLLPWAQHVAVVRFTQGMWGGASGPAQGGAQKPAQGGTEWLAWGAPPGWCKAGRRRPAWIGWRV